MFLSELLGASNWLWRSLAFYKLVYRTPFRDSVHIHWCFCMIIEGQVSTSSPHSSTQLSEPATANPPIPIPTTIPPLIRVGTGPQVEQPSTSQANAAISLPLPSPLADVLENMESLAQTARFR